MCILLGGVGSVVSVMTRLTGQHLELDHDAGTWQLRLLGGFRPVIGAVFGIVLFFIVGSGLIPIEEPTAPTDVVLFYGSLAFLAGFSERFAQDMLVATTQRVTTISGQTPPAAGTGQDELRTPTGTARSADALGHRRPRSSATIRTAVADTATCPMQRRPSMRASARKRSRRRAAMARRRSPIERREPGSPRRRRRRDRT